MDFIRKPLRLAYDLAERIFGLVFPAQWNPFLNLGALGFFFYWIITASGIYVYIFFDTGVHAAYSSVEYMTNDQWYAAGVMRSLHRYASDGLVLTMVLHMGREFSFDRYRGVRWFSWITGVPTMMMVFIAGITGYWLVWDKLAQYVALVSTEWLDQLPIFGEPIARNFMSPDALESRFFTLMVFMHIAIPLIALIFLWIHLQRVTKARINPPRGLAVGVLASMIALSLAFPAVSQGPANLAEVPGSLGLDWFYLPLFPLIEALPGPVSWGGALVLLILFISIPWLPPMRKPPVAVVDLPNCNGCIRCFHDCPYNAIMMIPRTDDLPYERQPLVSASLCTSCGICAGSCPTAMPFRKRSELVAGIDLPDQPMAQLREKVQDACASLKGESRILLFGCEHGVSLKRLGFENVTPITLRCIGQLPPSYIDFVLSGHLADGVVLTGCAQKSCYSRFGNTWTDQRLAGERDPHLRARVPRDRLKTIWAGRLGQKSLKTLLKGFTQELEQMPKPDTTTALRQTEKIKETVDG